MRFESILFDFDGTIAQSGNGIINGVKYACEKMGFTEGAPWEDWRRYIGPTVYRFTTAVLGLDERGRESFMELYSDYYKRCGIFESPLYEGIAPLLEQLRMSGAGLYIASSKPKELALMSLDYLKLEFDGVVVAEGELFRKEDIIRHCIELYELEKPRCVMVGDRDGDILGAKACGIASIGVSYGYGSRQELEDCEADFVVDSVEQLRKLLLA